VACGLAGATAPHWGGTISCTVRMEGRDYTRQRDRARRQWMLISSIASCSQGSYCYPRLQPLLFSRSGWSDSMSSTGLAFSHPHRLSMPTMQISAIFVCVCLEVVVVVRIWYCDHQTRILNAYDIHAGWVRDRVIGVIGHDRSHPV
jgi:hypothetical protein